MADLELRKLRRVQDLPDVVNFVDEGGKDLGWGEWELTLPQRLLIAELMGRWHQSFEITVTRMIRSGIKSRLKRMKKEEADGLGSAD